MTEEQLTNLNEAPASVNFYGVTAKGWNLQFTLRDTSEYALLDRFKKFVAVLEEAHVTPKPVGAQPSQPKETVPAAAGNYDGVFDVTELTCKIEDGKEYWKVRGGQFVKYGITVWPEVFKAAGLELDPMKAPHTLTGWKAGYTEDSDGKKKIVSLFK